MWGVRWADRIMKLDRRKQECSAVCFPPGGKWISINESVTLGHLSLAHLCTFPNVTVTASFKCRPQPAIGQMVPLCSHFWLLFGWRDEPCRLLHPGGKSRSALLETSAEILTTTLPPPSVCVFSRRLHVFSMHMPGSRMRVRWNGNE